MKWLIVVLVILVILLLAIFFCCPVRQWFCHHVFTWLPTTPGSFCGPCSNSHAKIKVEDPGISIWKDGTVAISIPVRNVGDRGAGNVTVSSLTISGGSMTLP